MKTQIADLREESEIRRAAKASRDRRIRDLRASGISTSRIAMKVGEKQGTVSAILKRLER